MSTAVLDTSIDAYYSMPNTTRQTQHENIMAIVKFMCSKPGSDISLQEIYKWYKVRHPDKKDHIEYSTIAARVNDLVTAKRLFRKDSAQSRKCSITHIRIRPVCLPSIQFPLFQ